MPAGVGSWQAIEVTVTGAVRPLVPFPASVPDAGPLVGVGAGVAVAVGVGGATVGAGVGAALSAGVAGALADGVEGADETCAVGVVAGVATPVEGADCVGGALVADGTGPVVAVEPLQAAIHSPVARIALARNHVRPTFRVKRITTDPSSFRAARRTSARCSTP
jgi:hypothetical protein